MKKLITLLLIFIILFFNNTISYAYDKEMTQFLDATNVLAWHQSNHPERNDPAVPDGVSTYEVAPGRALGTMGCSYFATSYMLVKMQEEDPLDGFNPLVFAKNAKDNNITTPKNYVDFKKLSNIYNDVTCEEFKAECKGNTIEEKFTYIKGKINNGYFVILCIVSDKHPYGHYIFVDGFTKDGEMIIGDSAEPKDRWSDSYEEQNAYICDITLFKHSKISAKDCPSIYSDIDLNNSMTYSEIKLYESLNK